MQLDRITAVLRPRSNWEAVDLGVLLLRKFHKSVLGAWLFTVLPVCTLIMVITPNIGLGILVIWLLRPLFDRVPLFVLSRALFGATPPLSETLKAVPRLWTQDLWGGLVLYRLSPMRSLIMPVGELEGLRGSTRRKRHALLARETERVGFLVSTLCFLFEFALILGLCALAILMIPSHMLGDYNWDSGLGLTWEIGLLRIFYVLAFSAVGPLHVACGFALYINRRTHLEGWDVEIALRRIGQRLSREGISQVKKVGALLLLVGSCWIGAADQALAGQGESPSTGDSAPDSAITEIMAHEDFARTHTAKEWDLPDFDLGGPNLGMPGFLGSLIELLLWAALIGLIVFIVYRISRNMGLITRTIREVEVPSAPPSELFGLDLRPESIPDDVPAAVWQLWQDGQAVEALGLLYRAAISRLIERDALELTSSDTESDCLRRVRRLSSVGRVDYFASVTRNWQICAYSHEPPVDADVRALCDDWSQNFEGGRS